MILTLRTDKPEAEIGLYEDNEKLAYVKWLADRNLSTDIHKKIDELFKQKGIGYQDLAGIILYKGPGSFTGLRIGASVANTIAYELGIPIAGTNGAGWIEAGIALLKSEPDRRVAELEYGEPPKTTKPRK